MNNSNSKVVLQLTLLISILFSSCSKSQTTDPTPIITNTFAKGADVGWLSQMEATGYRFYDADGTEKNGLQLLKDRGMNTIRLRVFVNPSNDRINGHCSKDETVAMAVRAKNLGMLKMIALV